jgi:hypothetical protein
MPRPPIGEKAMTPAERQRRHRDIVTQKPMTKSERDDLAKLIRHREAMMTAAATQRSKELLAEFEQQMASNYSDDEDETWKAVTNAADAVVQEAAEKIAQRCAELGIPARFAPTVKLVWIGRGENALAERRAELRRVAKSRIEALETDALTKIKMFCHEAHSRVLAHGLTSSSAIAFFDSLPDAAAMMPVLEMPAVEQLLDTRKADSHLNRYRQIDRDWAE